MSIFQSDKWLHLPTEARQVFDVTGAGDTVISGIALGLAYSNRESLHHAIETRNGTYWSRSRDSLWVKGATSGATQQLLGIRLDCDSDCLRFMVTQDPPGFCHKNRHTCFGEERSIATVLHRLAQRIESSNEKSFTRRLATDARLGNRKNDVRALSEDVRRVGSCLRLSRRIGVRDRRNQLPRDGNDQLWSEHSRRSLTRRTSPNQ